MGILRIQYSYWFQRFMCGSREIKEKIEVEVGDKIRHADWGIGTVLEKIGTENDIFITVDFKKVGLKKLSMNYAPLEKV